MPGNDVKGSYDTVADDYVTHIYEELRGKPLDRQLLDRLAHLAGPVGPLVPVFHFHDERRAALEPAFAYLRENGYHTITAQLSIDGAAKAIEFYKRALGAEVIDQAIDPSGKVWHASLRIGDSMLMVNDTFPEMGAKASSSSMWLYVSDTDASYKRAVDAGATSTMAPGDQFWGDRMGQVTDPFGQKWTFATHIKDMTKEEMKAAEQAFVASTKKKTS